MEVDGAYNGIPHTSIRFAGAYNDAKYVDFKNAGQPVENAKLSTPYRSGRLAQEGKIRFAAFHHVDVWQFPAKQLNCIYRNALPHAQKLRALNGC